MSSMLKVSEAFQSYRQSRQNGTLVHRMLEIFDSMTLYILSSREVDYNFDLLQQLSLIQKENTISQSPQEYQLAKEFKQFFKTYAEYQTVRNQNHTIVLSIIESTKALIIEAKSSIYNFIWSLPGFRKALARIDTTKNGIDFTGMDYNIDSIFAPVLTAHKREYTSNRKSARAFQSLTEKMSRPEFDAVFSYFMKIVRANRAYTYDNVASYSDTLSTYELLGTVLILAFKLIKNNPEYVFIADTSRIDPQNNGRMEDIWDLINILYFTLFEIKKSTADAYRANNDELLRLTDALDQNMNQFLARQVSRAKAQVEEGRLGLERLLTIVKEINNSFVDSIIFENAFHILDKNDTAIVYRLRRYLLERNIKPDTALSQHVCRFLDSVIQSRTHPAIKSEYIRLVMAYNLCKEYVSLGEACDTENRDNAFLDHLTTYLLTDARKLGDFALIHALDVLEHFSRFLIVPKEGNYASRVRCSKAARLYLGYLKESSEIYEKMVAAFLEVPDQMKTKILTDMMAVAGYCKDLILMLEHVGHESLEYIDPLLNLIEKVVDTKNLMNIPDNIDPAEIAVIDSVGPLYIEKFRPLLLNLLKHISEKSIIVGDTELTPLTDEWRDIFSLYHVSKDQLFSDTVFRLILRSDSVRILKDIFHIDLNEENIPYLTIHSDTSSITISDNLIDAITYDILLSPVAIPTSSSGENFVLVNQRTMHRILLDQQNPFTRQPLTYDEVMRLNSRTDVCHAIDNAFDFLRRLSN